MMAPPAPASGGDPRLGVRIEAQFVVGEYEIVCAQLCGIAHFAMRGRIEVVEQEVFDAWLSEQPTYAELAQLAPGNPEALKPYIRKAARQDIPVVCVVTDAPDTQRLASVSADPFTVGAVAGDTTASGRPAAAPAVAPFSRIAGRCSARHCAARRPERRVCRNRCMTIARAAVTPLFALLLAACDVADLPEAATEGPNPTIPPPSKLASESLHVFTESGNSHVVAVFQTGHGGLLEPKGFGCGLLRAVERFAQLLKGHFLGKNFRRARLNGRTAFLGQGSHKFLMCCHYFFSLYFFFSLCIS